MVVLHETMGVGREWQGCGAGGLQSIFSQSFDATESGSYIKRALFEPNPKFQAAHEAITDHMGHGNSTWSFGIREEDGRCYITTLNTEEAPLGWNTLFIVRKTAAVIVRQSYG